MNRKSRHDGCIANGACGEMLVMLRSRRVKVA